MTRQNEQVRSSIEEIEQLECAGADVLIDRTATRSNVASDHCLDFLIRHCRIRSNEVHEWVTSSEGRGSEAAGISESKSAQGGDVWNEFYSCIKEIKELHRRCDMNSHDVGSKDWQVDALAYANQRIAEFTGDENRGKYIDLGLTFQAYMNLKKVHEFLDKEANRTQWMRYLKQRQSHGEESMSLEEYSRTRGSESRRMDYVTWLQQMDSFLNIPRHLKYRQNDYKEYLEMFTETLQRFTERQRPLLDIATVLRGFEEDFSNSWLAKEVPGWETLTAEMPLYCKETDRLFSTDVALSHHVKSNQFIKQGAIWTALGDSDKEALYNASVDKDRVVAKLEYTISRFKELLEDTIADTVEFLYRKQARTAKELAAELAQLEGGSEQVDAEVDGESDDSSSGGEEVTDTRDLYNPKGLPMGPDGKPIPYWQYKLFGLDKEFTCEICGNKVYHGRRTFEKHFSEWTHINGLRALRITNSNYFIGVTGIQDALLLNDKLRQQLSRGLFNAEKEMECEDAMGNVMSYKAYRDLARQGMI